MYMDRITTTVMASVQVHYPRHLVLSKDTRIIMMFCLLLGLTSQVKDGVEDSWQEEEVWRMELYVSAGILALGLLCLLAVTSLPSVSNAVNWREFTFVQVCPL